MMSEGFKNKYRNETTRLKSWNYGWNGSYFITICAKNRERYFGEIETGEMYLSEIGKIANQCWVEIPDHYPFVKLGEFVIMPNHVHGIIIIDKKDDGRFSKSNVGTQDFASLHASNIKQASLNKFGPQSQNLASIIRGFKIGVTKQARKSRTDFQWQARYYDHIIRDQESFNDISEYIKMNPENWKKDKYYE
ncbi:MAG: transposase [Balneola sp.]